MGGSHGCGRPFVYGKPIPMPSQTDSSTVYCVSQITERQTCRDFDKAPHQFTPNGGSAAAAYICLVTHHHNTLMIPQWPLLYILPFFFLSMAKKIKVGSHLAETLHLLALITHTSCSVCTPAPTEIWYIT